MKPKPQIPPEAIKMLKEVHKIIDAHYEHCTDWFNDQPEKWQETVCGENYDGQLEDLLDFLDTIEDRLKSCQKKKKEGVVS